MAAQLRTQQNDTVDALCWRHYGRTAGVVEAVLDANPGLADRGAVLQSGVLVNLPEIQTSAPERQMVNLWE
ncbi:phage tail protein [Pseudomonas plecoglossicida]|uniref:tail protein X n=1 Tax=Pseudomonas TaxID=286 RepID=UPI0002A1520A|nr:MULTISPECIES: tail protein X [Pseudomonas]AGA74242.1 phage P2 tail gpX-like protein [Pseudomonas putida HB3267]MCE0942015.1 tail protein X [Pseudomonas asiatica]MCE0953115.1 tail protein X [Pseudomonas asiatica]MCE1062448.1 tail protein X [Pseudomonas asiatica]MCE1097769.1 tail protein X [Pseudomonas asiatica]